MQKIGRHKWKVPDSKRVSLKFNEILLTLINHENCGQTFTSFIAFFTIAVKLYATLSCLHTHMLRTYTYIPMAIS